MIFLAVDGALAGLIAVADPIKASTAEAITQLRRDGLRIVMATGDGTATAHVRCTAETATPIEGSGTLVEMARLQGDGFVVRSERRVLVGAFVKRAEGWTLTNAKLEVTA